MHPRIDEVMDVESYMPPEPMAPSVYGAYTNAPYSAEFETGYLNGQLVSTGVGYQSTSPVMPSFLPNTLLTH